jgi:hypothetical protein
MISRDVGVERESLDPPLDLIERQTEFPGYLRQRMAGSIHLDQPVLGLRRPELPRLPFAQVSAPLPFGTDGAATCQRANTCLPICTTMGRDQIQRLTCLYGFQKKRLL